MSWMALVDRTLRGEPIPARHFNEALPLDFHAFIMKCLQKDKNDRFGTAAEAAAALRAIERRLAPRPGTTPTDIPSGESATIAFPRSAIFAGDPASPARPPSATFRGPPAGNVVLPRTADPEGGHPGGGREVPHAGSGSGAIGAPGTPRPVATRRRRARNRGSRAEIPDWLRKATRPGLAVAAALALLLLVLRLMPRTTEVDWATFASAAALGQVTDIEFRGDMLRGTSQDPDVGAFRVPLGGFGLQELGRELEDLGVAMDPGGRRSSLRLDGAAGGDSRSLVIEGVDGCQPCAVGGDVDLAAGWYVVRWQDQEPDTGTIVLSDLEGVFPDVQVRVAPAPDGEASGEAARFFVGHGQRLGIALPALPVSDRVASGVADGEVPPAAAAPTDAGAIGPTAAGDADSGVGTVTTEPTTPESGPSPVAEGALGDSVPGDPVPSVGEDLGVEPGAGEEESSVAVCSNLASVTLTDFSYVEGERALRLSYELFFDAPGLEVPPVQALEMGLAFQLDGQPAGSVDFTHFAPEGTVVRDGRAGFQGTRVVQLDEAVGNRSVAGVRISARLRAQPVQPEGWPAGCAPPGFMESAGRSVVIPGTIVSAFSRGVLQFSLTDLQVSDEPERSLATLLAVELDGAAGTNWCAAGVFTLVVGDNEYALGTAVRPFVVGETRTRESVRFWATLEPGELPPEVPNAAQEARARASARVYDQACTDLDLSTAVPVQEEEVGPICLRKAATTAWEPCT